MIAVGKADFVGSRC